MIFFWIALYGLAHFTGEQLVQKAGAADWVYGAVLLLYSVLFVLWTIRAGNGRPVGLDPVYAADGRNILFFLPLGLLPVCNLLGSGFLPDSTDVLVMLSVSVTEELFFRGYLLSFLRKKGDLFAISAVSILFAAMHCVNGMNHGSCGYILLQVLCAFAASVCYCGIVIRFRSILPCVAAHFFTNITGNGTIVGSVHFVGLIACIAGYLCYGMWLSCGMKHNTKETVS